MRLAVLALDDVFDTGLSLLLDTLATANMLAPDPELRTQVALIGVRPRVTTSQGFGAPVGAVPRTRPDVVIVPALGCKTPETVAAALARPDVADACALLRRWQRAGTLITAACTATFVLAEAGLLDARRATTTWWLAPFFRERFPRVTLDEGAMVVDARGVVTAGSALAHLDLALWLIRRRSPTLARAVGCYLLYDSRPSQAPYVMPDHLAHSDPLVDRFETWARRHLADFSIQAAARACGASERTLERRVRAVLGRSPVAFVRDLRVAHAIHRLATTDDTLDELATAVGYRDAVSLRTLLREKTGRGVRELRRARHQPTRARTGT